MAACVGDDPGANSPAPDGSAACASATEGCACTAGGACDPGPFCASKLCVRILPDGAMTDASRDGGDSADADSGQTPSECSNTFYPEDGAAGPFCPFTSGGSIHCGQGMACCEPPPDASPSQCVAQQAL